MFDHDKLLDDIFDDDFFKQQREKHDKETEQFFKDWDNKHHIPSPSAGVPVMELVIVFAAVVGALVLLALLCRCCRGRTRGRVLAPPPDPHTSGTAPAPYPQQQYATVTVTAMPTVYPNSAPYPTAYPVTTAYPAGGAPYPASGAPYPASSAPYPASSAPYPAAGAPYPAMPLPAAPSAPDSNAFIGIAAPGAGWHPQAMPPSYEQAMGKHPPYNPAYHPQ